MNRPLLTVLSCALLFSSALAEQSPENSPSSSGKNDQAILQADHALSDALLKSDPAAAAKLLDDQFQWTDANGKTSSRTDTLRDIAALAQETASETDMKIHSYAELGILFGFHRNERFSRIWVNRPAGWKALLALDTPKPTQPPAATPPAAGDCVNPCVSLPFTPATPADRAVIAEWQKTKMDEWHPDAADWSTHVAEEFLIINDRAERNKEQRTALARKWQEAGLRVPGDPVLSMSLSDFGDAVLMISRHAPYNGGKPYYNVRVFIHRDGHWPIAWSQQTTIQDAPAVPAVPDK